MREQKITNCSAGRVVHMMCTAYLLRDDVINL